MRLRIIETDTGFRTGLGEHRLPKGEATQGGSIKEGKRVKRIAFDFAPFNGSIYEACIEMGIVANQYGAAAMLILHFLAYYLEQFGESIVLVHRLAKGVVRVDAGEVERCLLDVGTLEGLYQKVIGAVNFELAVFVHAYDGAGNFEYCIGAGVEPACFYIHNNGQKAAKAIADLLVGRKIQAYVLPWSATRQATVSPARKGVRLSFPSGSFAGTVQLCFSSVILSLLRGRL